MRRSSFYVSLLAAICVAGCTSAKETSLNAQEQTTSKEGRPSQSVIVGLRPLMYAEALKDGDRADEADKLAQWLEQYLKSEYRVASQRLFVVDAEKMHWMSIVKFVGNEVEQPFGGCVEQQPWQSPGFDLATTWRFPEMPYKRIAVATLRSEDRTVSPVVGVFDLERIESSRNEENLLLETAPCPPPGSLPPG
jgi:hypothetical protein